MSKGNNVPEFSVFVPQPDGRSEAVRVLVEAWADGYIVLSRNCSAVGMDISQVPDVIRVLQSVVAKFGEVRP